MASKNSKKQSAIIAISALISAQVGDERLLAACQAAAAAVGPLDQKSMLKVAVALERFAKLVWTHGMELTKAVEMLLALVSDQLVFVGGPKRAAFEGMLSALEAVLHQMGPDYVGRESFDDACIFDGLDL